jgi:cytochrome c oxidase assembly protein subunit 15
MPTPTIFNLDICWIDVASFISTVTVQMSKEKAAFWFKRSIGLAVLLALSVVVLGAYVRLSDAGLGCPDWPGCYGQLTVPDNQVTTARALLTFPDHPVVVHKALKEMLHRYLAGILALVITGLFALAWGGKRHLQVSPWLPTLAFATVIFQALLGMWTVTLSLKPLVVSAHLLGGMTTMALLVWIAHRHWGRRSSQLVHEGLRLFIRGAMLIIFIQIFLGGWTSSNYAGLVCTDFPTCNGSWLPPTDFTTAYHLMRNLGQDIDGNPLSLKALVTIQWTHRPGALVTLLYIGSLAWLLIKIPTLKQFGFSLIALICLQVILGISNVLKHLPLVLAVGHNLVAVLLVINVVVLNSAITNEKISSPVR